jgi:endonuclease YncB( thermonuclease family)
MRTPCPILAILAGAMLAAGASAWQAGIRAVDGDTVDAAFVRWRLVGLDAPETGARAKCPQERARGVEARARLDTLAGSGKAVLRPSWPPWRGDKYGRRLARLLVDGKDAGAILISEGLARPYTGGRRGSWCP